MNITRKHLIVAGSVLVLAAAGGGIAYGVGGDDGGDEQATGPAAEKAKAAALEITGGGHANAVERDSEDGATWEVEVTKPDGQTVDVRLDASYGKVVVEGDSEKSDSDEGEE